MSHVSITVHCDRPQRFGLLLRVPRWAEGVGLQLSGERVTPKMRGGRMLLSHTWRGGETVELVFGGGMRLVPWPSGKPEGVAVYNGPLCLGLSSAVAKVDEPWRVRQTSPGRIELLAPSGKPVSGLAPVGDDWLNPDVHDPHRLRILFRE